MQQALCRRSCHLKSSHDDCPVRTEALHFKTRSSADADKPARRLQRSVKIAPFNMLCIVNYYCVIVIIIVFKTRRFSDIRLQKCRDIEIRVRGHSRSLKVVPLGMVLPISVL